MTATLTFDRFEVLPASRQVLVDGRPVALGARAFDVLNALIERRERLVTKGELLDLVWPGVVVEENNLQVHISALRKLLGPQAIATIPGRGYQFTATLDGAPAREPNAAVPAAPPRKASIDAAAAPLSNLAADVPPLYGRADDLPALRALIELHRLVTVVGAGGIGKTALAQALAHELRGSFDDGVWFVELAPVTDTSLVVSAVAGVLHVRLGGESQLENLASALERRRMLLVLDNCEHLLQRVAELAAALHRAAPNVRLLATSQEPLRIGEEQLYRLSPLTLPGDTGIDSARQAGAVALFVARARAAQPSFALSEQNVAAVVDICRRLDGIALAIELAAARVALLGVDALRARLDERFRVLTGGDRLALRRHQTLRAALEWSHGLLTQDEQIVFRRLGAFVGSFGLESAQRVAADADIDEWAVIDRLGALVDKSLVVAEPGEPPRYRLLETSRAYALEMLQQAGETETVVRSHAGALLEVFERSREDEYVLTTQARLHRYLPDLDNARAALEWAAGARADSQLHVALAGAIAWIWVEAALRPEGLRRTGLAISRIEPSTPPHLEARLLEFWIVIAFPETGPRESARAARVVALYRTCGDRRRQFVAQCYQSALETYRHDTKEGERGLQEAERLFDRQWPPGIRAPLLRARFFLLHQMDRFEESSAAAEELFRLASILDDGRMAIRALIYKERSAAALGRLEESVAHGREMLRRMRHDRSLSSGQENIVLANLCMSLTQMGRIDEALAVAHDAYRLVAQAGRLLDLLDAYALLAFKRGHIGDAARILGRSDMNYAADNYKRERVEQKVRDGLMADLQKALSPGVLSRLMEQGNALSDEDAVRLALRD